MLRKWKATPLYIQIFICLTIGVMVGLFAKPVVPFIQPIGDIFLRLLKMLIVPLTFFTLISGVLTMGDIKSLRQIGVKIILIFMATSSLAAMMGTVSGLIFNPGSEVQGLLVTATAAEPSSFSFVQNIISWFPTNIFNAMSTDNMLQIIFFAIFMGCVLLILGEEKAGTIIKFVRESADAMIKMTDIVMLISPFGILALIADMTSKLGSALLVEVVKFIVADYVALAALFIIVYPVILKVFGRLKPLRFYKAILPAMLVAASTTSSAATLPMSMKCAEENLGLPEKIYGFGLPLGATINMNGMAIAIGLISVFASNLYNYPVTFSGIIQFVFLGLILSMGCAGVKGAGVVMSTVLLQTLGMPLSLIPILAAIWPVLDIGHTTANITGDLVTSALVASRMDMIDQNVFNGRQPV